jgi:hypothetical protein
MTDYVKSTNFTSKDTLATGNPLKIVKGSEFDTEFNNIATAVATKADLAGPTFTGVPAAPTAAAGTNTTQVATTAFVKTAVDNYDAALTVDTARIEDDAVTTAKIVDDAVTLAKLNTTGTPSSSVFLRGDMAWATPLTDFFDAYDQEVNTYLFGTGFTVVDTQTYTVPSTYTWTKPSGDYVLVEIWGAGGSGGKDTYAGGGGGGGYTSFIVPASILPSTVSVTVGAGGASVSSSGPGNAGGSSSFGSFATATGGAAGLGNSASNPYPQAAGGTGGTPDLTSLQTFADYVNRVISTTLGSITSSVANGIRDTGGLGAGDSSSEGNNVAGTNGLFSGGGGGGRIGSTLYAAGSSTYGGAGGAGSTTTATAGTAPGGGGGGGGTASGAGGAGKVVVRTLTRP